MKGNGNLGALLAFVLEASSTPELLALDFQRSM